MLEPQDAPIKSLCVSQTAQCYWKRVMLLQGDKKSLLPCAVSAIAGPDVLVIVDVRGVDEHATMDSFVKGPTPNVPITVLLKFPIRTYLRSCGLPQ